jgi:hypothetical protein
VVQTKAPHIAFPAASGASSNVKPSLGELIVT